MKLLKIIALMMAVITILAQLYVPISMANRYENILITGESYFFKVVPRDPADPFKGRYVHLTFPEDSGQISKLKNNTDSVKELTRKDTAYAVYEKDTDGFAKIVDLQKTMPQNVDYIKVKMSYRHNDTYGFKLPFNRYYAEESKAPKIEALLWRGDREEQKIFYADVRIKDGYGVIAELYVDDAPILDYLRDNQ